MQVEIIFKSSATPKVCNDVVAVYEKGSFLCVQYANRLIVKYPTANLFSVAHQHGEHWGTTQALKGE